MFIDILIKTSITVEVPDATTLEEAKAAWDADNVELGEEQWETLQGATVLEITENELL